MNRPNPVPPVALVAGATGAAGSRLVDCLLARDDGTEVVTVGRRPVNLSHPRLRHVGAELDQFPSALAAERCDEAYCCLGTTMKKAGSRTAFRAIDYDGVVRFARAAHDAGARFFGLVSAAGADPAARNFYLRTKGEAEAAVVALGFASAALLRPGLLRGERKEFRLGERLGQWAAPVADRLLLGPLARYRSAALDDVAAALAVAGRQRVVGVTRLGPAAIEALARGR